MRVLLLLCAPLAMAACPKMLEGVPEEREWGWSDEIFDCIDVACGRMTFTPEFWSKKTVEELMKIMAADEIMRYSTTCNAECANELDKRYHARALSPLAQSVRASFDAMDNAEAKAHVLALYNHSYTYRLQERTAPEFDWLQRLDETYDLNALVFPRSVEAEFVNDVKTKGNQWVRAVEILPAAETLFLQYLTLDNEEAKEFILENNIQISKSLYFNNSWPVVNQQLSNGKHEQTLFDGLSTDARFVLESTFPELFKYLYNNDYIVKKNKEIF